MAEDKGLLATLFEGDFKQTMKYVKQRAIINLKSTAWEVISGGIHMFMYGSPAAPQQSNQSVLGLRYWTQPAQQSATVERGSQPLNVVPMTREFNPSPTPAPALTMTNPDRFRSLIFKTKDDAERYLDTLKSKIDAKEANKETGLYVTVMDMYYIYLTFINADPTRSGCEFTAADYGFSRDDIARARIMAEVNGYYIQWPDPKEIKNLVKKG